VTAEHPDIPGRRVEELVRREWLLDVDTVGPSDRTAAGSSSRRWVLGDGDGPRWCARVDVVGTAEERSERVEALEAAWQLAQHLPFAVVPDHTRDARIAVDVAEGLLLSVSPFLDGVPFGTGPLADDDDRVVVAGLVGSLHSQPRPLRLAVWRPRLGGHADAGPAGLEDCLGRDVWSGGPWSGPAGRLVLEARPVVLRALRRYVLLGAAVTHNIDRWVVTHGRPSTENLLRTADGPRLLDWSGVALAPRERDLREALGEAEGEEPWYAYMESGGRPEPLSPDTLELFRLQRHLSAVSASTTRLSRPHQDTEAEQRCFTDLERELRILVDGWA
jgi:hypothetical protein